MSWKRVGVMALIVVVVVVGFDYFWNSNEPGYGPRTKELGPGSFVLESGQRFKGEFRIQIGTGKRESTVQAVEGGKLIPEENLYGSVLDLNDSDNYVKLFRLQGPVPKGLPFAEGDLIYFDGTLDLDAQKSTSFVKKHSPDAPEK